MDRLTTGQLLYLQALLVPLAAAGDPEAAAILHEVEGDLEEIGFEQYVVSEPTGENPNADADPDPEDTPLYAPTTDPSLS